MDFEKLKEKFNSQFEESVSSINDQITRLQSELKMKTFVNKNFNVVFEALKKDGSKYRIMKQGRDWVRIERPVAPGHLDVFIGYDGYDENGRPTFNVSIEAKKDENFFGDPLFEDEIMGEDFKNIADILNDAAEKLSVIINK